MRNKERLLSVVYGPLSVVCCLLSISAQAQDAPQVPSLVVNIVIDQLRSDYLDAFTPLYGQGGFLRLKEQGRFYSQAEYPFARPVVEPECLVSSMPGTQDGSLACRSNGVNNTLSFGRNQRPSIWLSLR